MRLYYQVINDPGTRFPITRQIASKVLIRIGISTLIGLVAVLAQASVVGAQSLEKDDSSASPMSRPSMGAVVANQEPLLELDEVTITATREGRRTFEVPQDVTVVTREEIERRTPRILPDLLRGREGISVQQTTSGQGSPIIRGLQGSSILVLVDGMRLNNAMFRSAPNQYLALVDAQNVDSIEVVRGAGSTLYGSDAIGGVLNILTPVPRFDSNNWQTRGRALTQFASVDTSLLSRLSAETGKRGMAWSGGLTYQTANDLRGGGESGLQQPSAFRSYSFDSKMFMEGTAQDLLLNVQYLQQPRTPRFDEVNVGFGQIQPSSSQFFFQPNDRLFVHARYRSYAPVSFVDRLEANLAYQGMRDDRKSQDFGSVIELREKNASRMMGSTIQLTSHYQQALTLTYGGDAYLDRISSTRVSHDTITGQLSPQSSRFPDGSTLNSYGMFVQAEAHLNPKFTLFGGTRVSYFDIDIPQADRAVGIQLHPTTVTGNVGLLYRLTQEVHLVSNLGRGVRVPNVFDLSTLGDRPGNRFAIPNPNLKPEEAYSVDVGAKVHTTRLTGEAFVFHTIIPNRIEAELTGALTASGRTIVQSANLNRVDLTGLELGGRFHVTDSLDLYGHLTYTYGRERFPNAQRDPADRIPPLNGSIGVLYRPTPSLVIESFVQSAARQDRLSARDVSDPRINPQGTAGWVTANLRAQWIFNKHFSIKVAIENIGNQPYREHGSGINGPGRSMILALEGTL